MGFFSIGLLDGGEVTVKPIILWKEMRRWWVRRVHQSVVNVFVILSDSVPKSSLLDVLTVTHLVLKIQNVLWCKIKIWKDLLFPLWFLEQYAQNWQAVTAGIIIAADIEAAEAGATAVDSRDC